MIPTWLDGIKNSRIVDLKNTSLNVFHLLFYMTLLIYWTSLYLFFD